MRTHATQGRLRRRVLGDQRKPHTRGGRESGFKEGASLVEEKTAAFQGEGMNDSSAKAEWVELLEMERYSFMAAVSIRGSCS